MEIVCTTLHERLGENIRQSRLAAGLTQRELGDRLHITPQAVSKTETGVAGLSLRSLIRYAKALGVTPAALVEGLEDYV